MKKESILSSGVGIATCFLLSLCLVTVGGCGGDDSPAPGTGVTATVTSAGLYGGNVQSAVSGPYAYDGTEAKVASTSSSPGLGELWVCDSNGLWGRRRAGEPFVHILSNVPCTDVDVIDVPTSATEGAAPVLEGRIAIITTSNPDMPILVSSHGSGTAPYHVMGKGNDLLAGATGLAALVPAGADPSQTCLMCHGSLPSTAGTAAVGSATADDTGLDSSQPILFVTDQSRISGDTPYGKLRTFDPKTGTFSLVFDSGYRFKTGKRDPSDGRTIAMILEKPAAAQGDGGTIQSLAMIAIGAPAMSQRVASDANPDEKGFFASVLTDFSAGTPEIGALDLRRFAGSEVAAADAGSYQVLLGRFADALAANSVQRIRVSSAFDETTLDRARRLARGEGVDRGARLRALQMTDAGTNVLGLMEKDKEAGGQLVMIGDAAGADAAVAGDSPSGAILQRLKATAVEDPLLGSGINSLLTMNAGYAALTRRGLVELAAPVSTTASAESTAKQPALRVDGQEAVPVRTLAYDDALGGWGVALKSGPWLAFGGTEANGGTEWSWANIGDATEGHSLAVFETVPGFAGKAYAAAFLGEDSLGKTRVRLLELSHEKRSAEVLGEYRLSRSPTDNQPLSAWIMVDPAGGNRFTTVLSSGDILYADAAKRRIRRAAKVAGQVVDVRQIMFEEGMGDKAREALLLAKSQISGEYALFHSEDCLKADFAELNGLPEAARTAQQAIPALDSSGIHLVVLDELARLRYFRASAPAAGTGSQATGLPLTSIRWEDLSDGLPDQSLDGYQVFGTLLPASTESGERRMMLIAQAAPQATGLIPIVPPAAASEYMSDGTAAGPALIALLGGRSDTDTFWKRLEFSAEAAQDLADRGALSTMKGMRWRSESSVEGGLDQAAEDASVGPCIICPFPHDAALGFENGSVVYMRIYVPRTF